MEEYLLFPLPLLSAAVCLIIIVAAESWQGQTNTQWASLGKSICCAVMVPQYGWSLYLHFSERLEQSTFVWWIATVSLVVLMLWSLAASIALWLTFRDHQG